MTDLTRLTLTEARDGLKAKSCSATELAKAHVAAVEKARADHADKMAEAARLHAALGRLG